MTRRLIGLLATLAIILAPLIAGTQPPAKLPRIGYLGDRPGSLTDAFRRKNQALPARPIWWRLHGLVVGRCCSTRGT
jgi:hypothetical protein